VGPIACELDNFEQVFAGGLVVIEARRCDAHDPAIPPASQQRFALARACVQSE